MGTLARLLLTFGIRILEAIFALGIIGSALVILLAGIEGIREVFTRDVSAKEGTD
jgi:hypothetical protein